MSHRFQVTKSAGYVEPFYEEKLRHSLLRSGADEVLVNQVMQDLASQWHEGMSTKYIFKRAFKLLKRLHRPTAARYTLKQGMLDFGNSGFPFEDFFAEVMRTQGYEVDTRQILSGVCIQHEVDVVAQNTEAFIWIECKYHPLAGSVSNVKIPLYIHSRFRDLEQYRTAHLAAGDTRPARGWVVTNTRFSDDAMTYGRCSGLHLISWNYPSGQSLREMIDHAGLYPVTCLTTLTRREKEALLNQGIVLCQNLTRLGRWSDILHISADRRNKVMQEAQELCR